MFADIWRYIRLSPTHRHWEHLVPSSNDGAKGKPCFKAFPLRDRRQEGNGRMGMLVGFLAPSRERVDLLLTRQGHAPAAACAVRHAAHVSDTAFFEIHTA